jgi:hypothetical protein
VTCDAGRVELLNWGVGRPPVSAVVRDLPVECGPDVAPRSRAWKARPVPSFRPDATPLPQVRASSDRPLLSVSDRQLPALRVRGGHSRREPTALQRGGDGHKLNWRVRPLCDAHVPRWQEPKGLAQDGTDPRVIQAFSQRSRRVRCGLPEQELSVLAVPASSNSGVCTPWVDEPPSGS